MWLNTNYLDILTYHFSKKFVHGPGSWVRDRHVHNMLRKRVRLRKATEIESHEGGGGIRKSVQEAGEAPGPKQGQGR